MYRWLLTTRELEKHFERSEMCLSIPAALDFFFSWALWIMYGAPSEYIMLSCSGMFFVISGPPFLSLSRCICLKFPLNAQFLLEALPWKLSFLPMFSVGFWLPASLITPEMAVWLPVLWSWAQTESSASLCVLLPLSSLPKQRGV